jgi:PAS domain S-box-containing protein
VTEQVDRSQLQQIIAGLTEGVILIEPDQRITYANEAALRMHGVERLADLGVTVDTYRANFVLRHRNNHPLRPGDLPIEKVVRGEAVEEVVVQVARRDRPDQDWAHRIRSLVVTNAGGQPDCLVLVIADVSNAFEAEERFDRMFAANPAPAAICRLADQRFVRLNEGFLELTGYTRDEVLGRTLHEVDVLRRAERRDLALERLRAGQTIPQMEASLDVPSDPERLVIVAGQPLEVNGCPCMLFTFADLEPRRKAEALLRHSEERFVKTFRLAPIPMAVAVAEGHRIVDVNEAFCAATSYAARELVGQSAHALGLWVDEDALSRFERLLSEEGSVRAFEAMLRAKDGTELACLIAADTAVINGQPSLLIAFQDISARKRSEAELRIAIDAVMQDASWFSQAVVEKLATLRSAPQGRPDPAKLAKLSDLTGRERDVLALICRGLNDEGIGAELGLSRNTVRNHVASLYRKLGVNRRSAVIVWARERGVEKAASSAQQPMKKQSRKH